ncbi:hypothetical protein [Bradyrhizobium sp. Arg816]|uniref:hypothetical protein n=1 Tax=Bradyrhizobium sp. Arg816 TaxID=2998491 RepID=UPI00249ED7AB|nr:hypothetical protein [Bradyrhizobium sp. Arg816]MDI3567504.1 hypothetical protein [Bradyrhizobium sp. Arg816]
MDRDRSIRHFSSPSQTLAATCADVGAFDDSATPVKQIATEVGMSPAIVSPIRRRLGLNRLRYLDSAEPARRYERQHPGGLVADGFRNAFSKAMKSERQAARGLAQGCDRLQCKPHLKVER